jgi:signal transduction histidine kinase
VLGTVLVAALDMTVMVGYGRDSFVKNASDTALLVAWTVGGLVASRLRPGNRLGTLMLRLALVLAVNLTLSDHFVGGPWPVAVLVTAASAGAPLTWAAGIHVGLAFPSGRLRDRASVVLVRTAYVWSGIRAALFVLGHADPACPTCVAPLTLNLFPAVVSRAVVRVDEVAFIVVIGVFGFVYLRQWLRSSARQRRVSAYPSAAIFLAAAFAVTLLGLNVEDRPVATPVYVGLELLAVAAVPAGFLLGLLRERLDEARVADLVAQLAVAPDGMLSPPLARALGDASAQLVFASGTGYADRNGKPVHDGPHTRLTPVGDPASPIAFILHDRSLDAQPELVASVGAATGLALDNARLRVELLAQLAEVRASRERLVEAGDNARRRLERDLHDGAQQSLISLGMSLRLIRQRIGDADSQTLALIDETEQQARAAIRELRELARGIHPTILTEQGLGAALEQLARRCPVRVRLEMDSLPALPPAAEVTAYYVASEGLANIAKHATASAVELRITTTDQGIHLQVSDDGVGGAAAGPGSGLAGLVDRVAAIGGRLTIDSGQGRGTRIEAFIPTAPRR